MKRSLSALALILALATSSAEAAGPPIQQWQVGQIVGLGYDPQNRPQILMLYYLPQPNGTTKLVPLWFRVKPATQITIYGQNGTFPQLTLGAWASVQFSSQPVDPLSYMAVHIKQVPH